MCGAAVLPLIYFHGSRGILRHAHRHRSWLRACWQHYACGRWINRVDYHFVSRETIAGLHARFLHDPTPTDILTFDYEDAAEIFICPEVVRENACLYAVSFSEELRRVLVHGLLHLGGLEDTTDAGRRDMRAAEDFCLRAWQNSVSHETFRARL